MTEHTDAHPPFPRLWHCDVGSEIQLTGETRTLIIEAIEGRYAIFLGGQLKVGRCHRVNQYERRAGQEKSGKQLMIYDSDGWRPA